MNITPQLLNAIYYGYNKLYQSAFEKAPKWADRIATTVPSTGASNRYAWMKTIPRLREWIGERVVNNVSARGYEIVNKKFELTEAISRESIEDDQLGVFNPLFEMMGQQAAMWPEDLIIAALQGGITGLSYDGQPFFSASHPVDQDVAGAGTFSNNFTGTPLTPTNYQAVRSAMGSYLDVDGKALKVNPMLLVVPPQLEATARQILNADFIAPVGAFGGNAGSVVQSNVLKGSAELLVIPDLANQGTTWYLMDVSKPIKPFVIQVRNAAEMVMLNQPHDRNVFLRDEYLFGIRTRGNSGYSLPFLAARAIA